LSLEAFSRMKITDAADLIARQDALQSEASSVLDDLDLLAHLRQAGEVMPIGSYALGLMVWRDIDIDIYCASLSADRAFAALRPLASHPRIVRLNFDNWRGPNGSPDFPNGYYWGLRYRTEAGREWKLDLWFLPDGLPRREVTLMSRRLTPEVRQAILSLKDIWHRLPSYNRGVASIDVYDAVLHHDVRTRVEFARYLHDRGMPVDGSD